jgi:2-C-methyl-D-erythritol 4-phosphate cytidylyltransferase
MREEVIIVAGGIGSRMKSELPKQFIAVHDRPVIIHAVEKFYRWKPDMHVVVVMNKSFLDHWAQIREQNFAGKDITTVEGGDTRFQSVKKGLSKLKYSGVVAIHDAARPCVSVKVIGDCFRVATLKKTAIPVLQVTESLRKIEADDSSISVNRNDFVVVQTPQCFHTELLKEAYKVDFDALFTDDASVVEAAGDEIHLVAGNPENIKVTEPSDLVLAEVFLRG